MKNPTVLVFQYGSNCLDSEINSAKRLRGDANFVGIAETVEDFEIAFDVFSMNRNCAAADIVRRPGGKVWGALYKIPEYLIKRDTAKSQRRNSLDAIEGEGTNYKRESIDVRRTNGEIVQVTTYIVKSPKDGLKTSIEYVRLIVCGLRERGVPPEYITTVKLIAAANNPGIAAEIERT